MTLHADPATAPLARDIATVCLDIVVPVHNEERVLVHSIETLVDHLQALPFRHQVTIADNASTDATHQLAQQLAERFDAVQVVSLQQKGRGRALKRAWSQSTADVLVYMDVDLSTDLNALLPLIAPLVSGHSDLAIGSRLTRTSRTSRGPKREFISRTYNLLLRGTLHARFSDAQCGFKAIRRDVAAQLLPLIQDDEWFFDTELLIVAERAGLRIHEVPVDWTDDPDSRVDIVRTARADLRGMARLGWALLRGRVPLADLARTLGRARTSSAHGHLRPQVLIFALIGLVSTCAYGVLYLILRGPLGPLDANWIALAATAVANTAANRRFTFGLRGPHRALTQQLQGLLVFGCGVAVTTGALGLLHVVDGSHHVLIEVLVLTTANCLVTVVRFASMRWWMFRTHSASVQNAR